MVLKCPICGREELRRIRVPEEKAVTIVFKCLFAVTVDEGLSDEEIEELFKSDEFKRRFKEWLRTFP